MRRKNERPTCGSARFVHLCSNNAIYSMFILTVTQTGIMIGHLPYRSHRYSSLSWLTPADELISVRRLTFDPTILLLCRASSLRSTWKETQRVSSDRPSGFRTNRKVTVSLGSHSFISYCSSKVYFLKWISMIH